MTKIQFAPIKDTDVLIRIATLRAGGTTLIEQSVVADALDAKSMMRDRTDAESNDFHWATKANRDTAGALSRLCPLRRHDRHRGDDDLPAVQAGRVTGPRAVQARWPFSVDRRAGRVTNASTNCRPVSQ